MLNFRISMLTNVANPFLYAWLNPSFKEMLFKTLRGAKDSRGGAKFSSSYERKDTVIRNMDTVC